MLCSMPVEIDPAITRALETPLRNLKECLCIIGIGTKTLDTKRTTIDEYSPKSFFFLQGNLLILCYKNRIYNDYRNMIMSESVCIQSIAIKCNRY